MEFIRNLLNLYTLLISNISTTFIYVIAFVVITFVIGMLFKILRKILY